MALSSLLKMAVEVAVASKWTFALKEAPGASGEEASTSTLPLEGRAPASFAAALLDRLHAGVRRCVALVPSTADALQSELCVRFPHAQAQPPRLLAHAEQALRLATR